MPNSVDEFRATTLRMTTPAYDAIIVGGGPAGSTCARFLTRAGARVAIVDRAQFPRVKLCGGWLSAPIWEALALARASTRAASGSGTAATSPTAGETRSVACHGWFIRRYELDDFLLRRSGAELHLGVSAGDIARDGDGFWTVAGLRARFLIGAGGTHCPVARLVKPPRPNGPVGAQEHEFQTDARRGGAARAPGATASPSCCCTTICVATRGTSPRPTG